MTTEAGNQPVGASPPDPIKWSCLTRRGLVIYYGPDVSFGPSNLGWLSEQPWDEKIDRVEVSPSGLYVAMFNDEKVCVWNTVKTKHVWMQHDEDLPPQSSCVRRGEGQFGETFWAGTLLAAATGEPVPLPCEAATSKFSAATQASGHRALLCWSEGGDAVLSGYAAAPDSTQLKALPLWRRELDASVTEVTASACGKLYAVWGMDAREDYRIISTYCIKTGALVSTFTLSVGCADAFLGVIDSERFLVRHENSDADFQASFGICGSGRLREPWLVTGPACVTVDFSSDEERMVPIPGRCDVSLVRSRGYVVAVDNKTATPLGFWATPDSIATWAWPLAQCARYEHERALAAIAAVDELACVGGPAAAATATAIGLVRAVLDISSVGFVA